MGRGSALIEEASEMIRFALHGSRLQGEYALVLMNEEKRRWLLLRRGEAGGCTHEKLPS